MDRLHGEDGPPEPLLEAFDVLRAANLALWSSTSLPDRARVGRHGERGPESLELSFRMIAGHDRFHVAQARAALNATGG